MQKYKNSSRIVWATPERRPGRPPSSSPTNLQFGFHLTLNGETHQHTHEDFKLFQSSDSGALCGIREEGPELDSILEELYHLFRRNIAPLFKTLNKREAVKRRGDAALHRIPEEHRLWAAGLIDKIVEQSIRDQKLPPRTEWGKFTPARPTKSSMLDEVFLLNKRLLHELKEQGHALKEQGHELKELRADLGALREQFTALAGGLASRPTVALPQGPQEPSGASQIDDLLRGGPERPPAPSDSVAAPHRPKPTPSATGGDPNLGLKAMPALPSTKPLQPEQVHRNKVLDTNRPHDLYGADAIGESLAFSDMMKGK